MKEYKQPVFHIRYVIDKDIIATSAPIVIDDTESNPEEPVYTRKRDSEWSNW